MGSTFEDLMASTDRPMCIVTAAADGERSGCLVGFATQASIRPLRFLVLISKANHTFPVAQRATVLVVHVLRESDGEMARRFGEQSGDRIDKFADLDIVEGPARTPIIDGLDWVAGRVLRQFDLGDHVGFLLAPHDGSAARAGEPQLGSSDVTDLHAGHDADEPPHDAPT